MSKSGTQENTMGYDLGTIIIIVAVLVFYLRLIILQRQRIKKARVQYAKADKKLNKKNSDSKKPEIRYSKMGVQVRNWWLVGGGIVLIILGAAAKFKEFTLSGFDFWWIPVLIGIALMGLGVG
jgi:hypothetical protein